MNIEDFMSILPFLPDDEYLVNSWIILPKTTNF